MGKKLPRYSTKPGLNTIRQKGYKGEPSALTIYLKEVAKLPMMTREEEQGVAEKCQLGSIENRNQLVVSNLRFVISQALKFKDYGIALEDLIQVGNEALIISTETFDPKRGVKFISYAGRFVRRHMLRMIYQFYPDYTIPINKMCKWFRGEFPELDWLVKAERLDRPIKEDGSLLLDFVSDSTMLQDALEKVLFRASIERLLEEKFSSDVQTLIIKKFGLDGNGSRTYEELAQEWKKSRQRIQQVVSGALLRLRKILLEEERKAKLKIRRN